MAVLDETARQEVWRGYMRWFSILRELLGTLTKTELRAAIDATDTWIDDNAASYNSALPQPARGELSLGQKTLLFCFVALRRVSKAALKKFAGEVD